MPTIPLHHLPPVADAWHRVTSPGGYEWWYFDAEDVEHDRQIVAILFDGCVFHPGYLRENDRYRHHPTRVPPPLPESFRCAYFVVYEAGRIRSQFMTQYAPEQFVASTDTAKVSLGPNQLEPIGAGGLRLTLSGTPWKLIWLGPKLLPQTLKAKLEFSPRFAATPTERVFLSRQLAGAEHRWVLANPLCDVEGTINLDGADPIRFRGRGYHDHNYGAAPLGLGLKRWLWGRILFEDAACTFHFVEAVDPKHSDEIHLIHADAAGIREIPVARVDADWSGLTGQLLRFPRDVSFDDVLQLSHPRMVDSSPFRMRLVYDGLFRRRQGKAFCQIAYPQRLRWPVLGRMIGMSIDQRAVTSMRIQ